MGSTRPPRASPVLPQNRFPELLPFPKRGKLVIAIGRQGRGTILLWLGSAALRTLGASCSPFGHKKS
jgi:hypothetical protein